MEVIILHAMLCCALQAKKAELEEVQQQLADAQAELTELQASFEQVCPTTARELSGGCVARGCDKQPAVTHT